VLLRTVQLPSPFIVTIAPEMEGVRTDLTPAAIPRPRAFVGAEGGALGIDQPIASAALRIEGLRPKERTGVPEKDPRPSVFASNGVAGRSGCDSGSRPAMAVAYQRRAKIVKIYKAGRAGQSNY
jgi:hypothetical protein